MKSYCPRYQGTLDETGHTATHCSRMRRASETLTPKVREILESLNGLLSLRLKRRVGDV